MYLVEIFLPQRDNEGQELCPDLFSYVREELLERFGGMTAFTRVPVEELWNTPQAGRSHDALVIYEVMVQQLDRPWWESYIADLERCFAQEEMVIRVSKIDVI
ncbi:hypothetical protein [Pseudomonas graminis]|uniref:Uncharacterized protein n=1 Tax=Pseudomonas graminis TaxID=158627 RepID=A0A1C2ECN3_9PSED|nr:hypothetical protein [Pseudomonas graminis]OCX24822.1 hypothetical protein BBI10_04180 [Pseudomonas graminis]